MDRFDKVLYAACGLMFSIMIGLGIFLVVAVIREETTDHGRCLATQTVPAHIEMVYMPNGRGGFTMLPQGKPETTDCTRWEFPDGRPAKAV